MAFGEWTPGISWNTMYASAGILQTDGWHHVAAIKDHGVYSLFLDGVLLVSRDRDAEPYDRDTGLASYLGYEPNSGGRRYFDGLIDEVRISNVVRYTGTFTPQTHFEADADTIGLWHFNEGAGQSAADASGNGNDATLHGSASWSSDSPEE